MKRGEKIMFGLTAVLSVLAVVHAVQRSDRPATPRDYYEWTELGLAGHRLYLSKGCNSCHRTLGVGESGVAPVLDGEGTKRSDKWIRAYLEDPGTLVTGTAHDGRVAPDFRTLSADERNKLTAFLEGLKASPGSRNYPVPPAALDR